MSNVAHQEQGVESGESGDEDGSESESEGLSDVDASQLAQETLPRARPRRPAYVPPVSIFGAVPKRCSSWGIKQATRAGQWVPLSHGDDGVKRQEWPLSELSEENVRAWWGPGTYRVMWFEPTEGGGRRFQCMGRVVEFEDAPAPPVVVRAPAPAAAGDAFSGLDATLRVLDVIDGRADAKISGIRQLAEVLGIGRSQQQGISGEDLLRILREERQAAAESTKAAIAAAVEPLQRRLEELVDDDDDDDDENGIASAAVGAAAPLIKGKGTLATVLNFASANPKLVEAGLPIVAGALSSLGNLFAASNAATAEAAAAKRQEAAHAAQQQQQQRPRAEPRAPAPPPPEDVVQPGIANGWEVREPPKAPAAAEAPSS